TEVISVRVFVLPSGAQRREQINGRLSHFSPSSRVFIGESPRIADFLYSGSNCGFQRDTLYKIAKRIKMATTKRVRPASKHRSLLYTGMDFVIELAATSESTAKTLIRNGVNNSAVNRILRDEGHLESNQELAPEYLAALRAQVSPPSYQRRRPAI